MQMLKEISDSDDVLEVVGDYTGNITASGSSDVRSDYGPLRNLDLESYFLLIISAFLYTLNMCWKS